MSSRLRAFCLALLALAACATTADPKAADDVAGRLLHLRIVSSADTNGGTALHVLVRKTTKADYPRQEYDEVAASLLLESDPNTLEWLVVSPDRTQDVWVERPLDAEVGVYFLFSDPRGRWKHLVEGSPIQQVHFHVGRDEIRQTHGLSAATEGD